MQSQLVQTLLPWLSLTFPPCAACSCKPPVLETLFSPSSLSLDSSANEVHITFTLCFIFELNTLCPSTVPHWLCFPVPCSSLLPSSAFPLVSPTSLCDAASWTLCSSTELSGTELQHRFVRPSVQLTSFAPDGLCPDSDLQSDPILLLLICCLLVGLHQS